MEDSTDDAEWVRLAGEGDARACRALVDRHLKSILGFSYRLLGDRAEAEDVAQETFVRLWRHAAAWRPKAKVSTWLHHIARNLCLDRLRKRRGIGLDQIPEPIEEGLAATDAQQQRQVSDILQKALVTLPERQRTAILLVHFQGLSNSEAADNLNVSISALESLLARGRRGLRVQLTPLRPDLF